MKHNRDRWTSKWTDNDLVTLVTRSGEKWIGMVRRCFKRDSDGKSFVKIRYLNGPRQGQWCWDSPLWTFGSGQFNLTCLDPGCGQVFYTDDMERDFCPCCERTMTRGSSTSQALAKNTLRGPKTSQRLPSSLPVPAIDEDAAARQRALDEQESRF
jgi:hypothetical protein